MISIGQILESTGEQGQRSMAKKPIRVFRTPPGEQGLPPPQRPPSPPAGPQRVPVYNDGANKDRRSITQEVVDHPSGQKVPATAGTSRYEELLSSVYDSVLITDLQGNIREVNDRAEHCFVWTRDELREGNIVQLISGADEHLLEVIRGNINNRKFTVLEAICLCGNGSRFNAEVVVNRLTDQEIVFFIRDVTQRKKMEDDLKQASGKLGEADKTRSRLDAVFATLYELNSPLQILTCMAELDKNEEYRKQLDRIVAVLSRLRELERPDAEAEANAGGGDAIPSPDGDPQPGNAP